jgi:hypothetical protein
MLVRAELRGTGSWQGGEGDERERRNVDAGRREDAKRYREEIELASEQASKRASGYRTEPKREGKWLP